MTIDRLPLVPPSYLQSKWVPSPARLQRQMYRIGVWYNSWFLALAINTCTLIFSRHIPKAQHKTRKSVEKPLLVGAPERSTLEYISSMWYLGVELVERQDQPCAYSMLGPITAHSNNLVKNCKPQILAHTKKKKFPRLRKQQLLPAGRCR